LCYVVELTENARRRIGSRFAGVDFGVCVVTVEGSMSMGSLVDGWHRITLSMYGSAVIVEVLRVESNAFP